MDEHAWLAERFEEHQTRLRAVAYRMLWVARGGGYALRKASGQLPSDGDHCLADDVAVFTNRQTSTGA